MKGIGNGAGREGTKKGNGRNGPGKRGTENGSFMTFLPRMRQVVKSFERQRYNLRRSCAS